MQVELLMGRGSVIEGTNSGLVKNKQRTAKRLRKNGELRY
mgnify:CR=1 FL=1